MGFAGKQVIHPSQIPAVQAAFSPSPDQVMWASSLIEAFHRHQQSGKVREGGRDGGREEGREGQMEGGWRDGGGGGNKFLLAFYCF